MLINTFSSFEEESIGSIQFNGEIINMILPLSLFCHYHDFAMIINMIINYVCMNFNSYVFDTYLTQSVGYSL